MQGPGHQARSCHGTMQLVRGLTLSFGSLNEVFSNARHCDATLSIPILHDVLWVRVGGCCAKVAAKM
jgi:hypothetical protein